ncbi:hypothetical protein AWC38_SpisGene11822 [Stylophora pistillata]|uniref:Uncharacterized protein n=1 Tax=Stylophora pistillata TaxID=50429 RepID=A0A2B4S3J1_STYPI|nr:hypothetical protein AWC38_SpisGene11822 [Stylophora pistillata]
MEFSEHDGGIMDSGEHDDGNFEDVSTVAGDNVPSESLYAVNGDSYASRAAHRTLSEQELRILSKGLKFFPTPTNVNKTELITDIKQWGRRMRLREYFGNDDNSNTELDDDITYKKPSSWTPSPGRDLALDCYLNGVERAILQHTPYNMLRSNITRLEREAIKSLIRDSGIVIFQADKGEAVVVQNKRDYLAEAYKQLNSTDENGNKVYKHVATDPTSDFVIRVKELYKRPTPSM